MGAMSASGTGMRKTPFEPQMPGFLKLWPPTAFHERLPEGTSWEECNRICAHMFEDMIVNEDASTIAGIILEPIGNTGGLITPTEEYFSIVRSICDRHNVHLILDETITGFCKTGSMFGCQTFNVVPDIIVTGKGVSNGIVPLAAMICQVDMAAAFLDEPAGEGAPPPSNFFAHGHTFANNPLACAVGSAVLKEMTTHSLDLKSQRLGEVIFKRLTAMQEKYGCIKEVRGKGILRGVLLVKDTENIEPWPELGIAMKTTAMRNGLIVRIDPTWFTVAPALCAEEEDIHELCDLVEQSLVDALAIAREQTV
jgi:putrescine aminotransferase